MNTKGKNITFTVDGKKFNVTIVNNSGFIVIPGLPENVYFVEVNFAGNDYAVASTAPSGYNVDLILVSKIVNTNCIYYNYDSVEFVDNLLS